MKKYNYSDNFLAMEKHIYSKRTIIKFVKKHYTDELKEMILLDTLYIQSENARYCEKVSEMKWAIAVDMTEFWGYSPEHEEYYSVSDRVDLILGDFVESQSIEILEKVLDNLN